MKWIILFLLLPLLVFGQQNVIGLEVIEPEYTTVTLDSTAESTVYYIFPPAKGKDSGQRTAISTTLPTSSAEQAKHQRYNASGSLTISIVTEFVTAQESDSLYAYVETLIYDDTKSTWYPAEKDSVYLVFDTPQIYTSTSIDYLNWTNNKCYTADVGGHIMPGAGIAVTFGANQNDTATADTKLNIGFWWKR